MRPSLQLVPESGTGDPGVTYVVSRTQLVEPGSPYVIAALADARLAEDYRHAEAEVYTSRQMRADRALARALDDWRAGDLEVFHRDREAFEQVEAAYRASIVRAARRHPSALGS